MKIFKLLSAVVALAFLAGVARADISFSGQTWQTITREHRDHPGVFNEYTAVDANTGSLRGVYNSGDLGDSVMITALSLSIGDKVSYDFYLSNNGNNIPPHNGGTYFGDATTVFQTTAGFPNNNWATDRVISGNNHDQFGIAGNNINLANLLEGGVHVEWTFDAASYSVLLTSLADGSLTASHSGGYWAGSGPADVQGFRVGLWDSEQTLTLKNFTITPVPEPGSMVLLGLGALGWALIRRRRG